MGMPIDPIEALQVQVLAYALEKLDLPNRSRTAAVLDSGSGMAEPLPPSEIERAVVALRAENHALRAEIRDLERRLYPSAAKLEAWERELENRRREARGRTVANAI